MTDSRQGQPGMPRLSHTDAEQLISARLDAPLPPEQNRILLAHLSTCPSCRAFAAQTEAMTQGFRALPMLPASPTVSRQVRERIAEGQSSWSRLSRLMVGSRWGAMPAMASALVLVAVVAFSLIIRGDGDSGNSKTPIPAARSTEIALTEESSKTPEVTPAEPTNTPYVKPRDEAKPTLPNVQVFETETSVPSITPSYTPTDASTETIVPSATSSPTDTATASVTATTRPSRTPEPTGTATTEPSETPEPTQTATTEPSETPVPTEEPSATSEPTETATTKPSETPVPTETASATPKPTRTPTEEPSETATSTQTHTPEPTATRKPTQTPTETATSRPTRTATLEPTKTEAPTRTPTPEPTETETLTPTETPSPRPSRTPKPTETPSEQVQPTIVLRGSGEPTQAAEEPTVESDGSTVVIEFETPTEESLNPTPGDTSKIQPKSSPTEEVTETPTETDDSADQTLVVGGDQGGSSGLDGSQQLGAIGSGVAAPAGGLRMPLDLAYLIVTGPDGSLAVADAQGNLIQSLGAAAFPVWSPKGLVLLFEDVSGELPSVVSWDRDEGTTYQIGPDSDVAVADIPAGWVGAQIYYLRSFPDTPGSVELRRSDWNGENDELVWSGDGIELNGERPVATFDGVLIPTANSWVFVDAGGGVSEFAAPAGFVGEPLLSPGGSLLAYPAGDQIIVVPTSDPGSVQSVIPYPDAYSGFDFSPDGFQMVVSDGNSLRIYSTDDGSLISEASNGSAVAFPHWSDDGIRYLALGDPTLLMLLLPGDFQPVS